MSAIGRCICTVENVYLILLPCMGGVGASLDLWDGGIQHHYEPYGKWS